MALSVVLNVVLGAVIFAVILILAAWGIRGSAREKTAIARAFHHQPRVQRSGARARPGSRAGGSSPSDHIVRPVSAESTSRAHAERREARS